MALLLRSLTSPTLRGPCPSHFLPSAASLPSTCRYIPVFSPSENIFSMLYTPSSSHASACLPSHSQASMCTVSWPGGPSTLLSPQKPLMSVGLKVISSQLGLDNIRSVLTPSSSLSLLWPFPGFLWNCALQILLSLS